MDTNEARYVEEQFEQPHKASCCGDTPGIPAGMIWGGIAGAGAALVICFITIAIVSGMIRRASTTEKMKRIRRQLMKKLAAAGN